MIYDLVFEGGGVRGVAFIGALQALADNGHQIGRVMGTSVGGLTAALLATGYDAKSAHAKMLNQKTGQLTFAKSLNKKHPPFDRQQIDQSATRELLRRIDFSFFPNIFEESLDTRLAQGLMRQDGLYRPFAIIEHTSISDGDAWLDWISDTLNEHAGAEDWAGMSLAEFHQTTGRSLTVIAADITDPDRLVLNHSTAPELPLKYAVRMTTGVPFLFPPVIWQREWGYYRQRAKEGHFIVDGALLSQFPIELFLSDDAETIALMGDRSPDSQVLGLILDEKKQVIGVNPSSSDWEAYAEDVPGLKILSLVYKTLMSQSSVSTADLVQSHVVRLPAMGVNTFDAEISKENITAVINSAYNVMQDFLLGPQKGLPRALSDDQRKVVNTITNYWVQGDVVSGDKVGGDKTVIGEVKESAVAVGDGAKADM